MSLSSNETTRRFPVLVGLSNVSQTRSAIGSPRENSIAGGGGGGGGGGVASPIAPVSPISPVGSPFVPRNRRKLRGSACTNMLVASHVQHYSIDAVLIDYNMPKMNGPDCIVELRNMGTIL